MKNLKLLLVYLLLPLNVLAYSNRLIIPAETIGIEIHSKGIYVVDFYQVNNKWIGKNAGLTKGDRIISINNKEINNLSDFNNIITSEGKYELEIERGNKRKKVVLEVVKDGNIIKTGLYVKDQINGIGTLSYIDPETRVFASLGHVIEESTNNSPFEIKNGYIYDSNIEYIEKSSNGSVGEIHANFSNEVEGKILKNELNGIYGKYIGEINKEPALEIAKKEEIVKGEAYLRMKLNNQLNDYKINILSIDEGSVLKNIHFEITDERLLKESGGIVQGMSGTPIIQKGKVIGVVNYVIVNNSKQGYGIFIESMLEEGDKILE